MSSTKQVVRRANEWSERERADRQTGEAGRARRAAGVVFTLLLAFAASPAFALSDYEVDYLEFGAAGYVPATTDPSTPSTFEYDHYVDAFLDPDIVVTGITGAVLQVAVVDDWVCGTFGECAGDWLYQQELARIDLNDVTWKEGQATLQVFFGEISATANLFDNDGQLHVTVTSETGDFTVLWSRLSTRYTYELVNTTSTDPVGAHMPEPSAALVFAVGALLVRRRVRHR